jgi:putative protease
MKNPQYVYTTVNAYKTLLTSSDESICKGAKETLKQDLARTKTTFNFIQKSEDIFTPELPKQIGLYLGRIISSIDGVITLNTNVVLNVDDEIKIVDASKDISYKAKILNVKENAKNCEIETDSNFARQGTHVFKTSDIKTAKTIENIFNKTRIEKQQFAIKEKKIVLPLFKDVESSQELFLKIDNPRWTTLTKNKNLSLIFSLDKNNIKNIELFKNFDYLELPPYIDESDLSEFQQTIDKTSTVGKKGFFINNFAYFHFFKNNEIPLFAGHYIYTLNSFAADFLFSKGIKSFEFSIEDDFKNILELTKKGLYSNGMFYISGFPVLAISLMKNKDLNQNKQFAMNSLKDSFQVLNKNGKVYVISQFPVMLFNKIHTLKKPKINKFTIDLSFIEPNKSYLDSVLDAFNGRRPLQNNIEFNFDRGLK